MALAYSENSHNIEIHHSSGMRQMLIAFYDEHMYRGDVGDPNQVFTLHDKEEALAYFDNSEGSISQEELFQRRTRCLFMLNKTKQWAQNQRKDFLHRLHTLDIARDRKNELQEQFLTSSFERKEQLLAFVKAEENRINNKKLLQKSEREDYKVRFHSFYESHSQYFCYEDRNSAWNNVLLSLAGVRTHKAKMHRLEVLLAMLPANLAYAQQMEAEYVDLLNSRVADDSRKQDCIAAFRECTFLRKAERIAELKQTPLLSTIEEKAQRIKQEHIAAYNVLYAVFPHGISPEEFAALPLKKRTTLLAEKKAQNQLELVVFSQLTQVANVENEALLEFRQLPLEEKKAYLEKTRQQKNQEAEPQKEKVKKPTDRIAIPEIPLCALVISVLRNQEKRVFADDKERVKLIKERMRIEGIVAEFSLEHLQIIRGLTAPIPENEQETPNVLTWVAERLRQKIYVGESRTKIHTTKALVTTEAA